MTLKSNLPKAIDNYLNFIYGVSRENQIFLLRDGVGKKTCDEVSELCNDAIDHMSYFAKRPDSAAEATRYAIINFTYHLLMPQSSALYTNLLLGNIITCFSALHLLTESLAICYAADVKFVRQNYLQEKLRSLIEKDGKQTNVSRHVKDLDPKALELWTQLSGEWIPTSPVADTSVAELAKETQVPVWALSSPKPLTDKDLAAVDELGKKVAQFRILLKNAMDKWKRDVLKVSVNYQ